MKYSDISKQQAREYCKKAKGQCLKCPLRRMKGESLLICAYILINMYENDKREYAEQQINIILQEDIEHIDE